MGVTDAWEQVGNRRREKHGGLSSTCSIITLAGGGGKAEASWGLKSREIELAREDFVGSDVVPVAEVLVEC